jgi:hypothetical protein
VILEDVAEDMRRYSRLIDQGLAALRDQTHAYAEAEREYRKAKAQTWLVAPEGTVPERTAWVEGQTADLRYARDLADGMRQAALEAVRSRRAQVSMTQTLLNADREEMAFSRTGPEAA